MYWEGEPPAEDASIETVQGLVRSAAEAAEANSAAADPLSLAAVPAPPEDIFRTRCLTFSHGVVVESGGVKDAAYHLLQDHCLERKSGLEVEKVPAEAEERCRHYAEAWL